MLVQANFEIHNMLFRWFRNIHSYDADGHRKSFHFDVNQSERTLHRSHSTEGNGVSYVHLQLKIYKEKENLSVNISIKSHPVFLSAFRSSVARTTSVPKVSPSRRRRSGSSSMTTGFADPMTILKQIFN